MRSAPFWLYQAVTRMVSDVSKVYAVGLGGFILWGGWERMQAPAYGVLNAWAPWWFWGGSVLFAGLLTLVPVLLVRVIGYWLVTSWFWVWWAAVTVNICFPRFAPESDLKPGLTSIPTYFFTAVVFTALAVASLMDWRERCDSNETG